MVYIQRGNEINIPSSKAQLGGRSAGSDAVEPLPGAFGDILEPGHRFETGSWNLNVPFNSRGNSLLQTEQMPLFRKPEG